MGDRKGLVGNSGFSTNKTDHHDITGILLKFGVKHNKAKIINPFKTDISNSSPCEVIQRLGLWCSIRHFQQYFSYIVAVSFIGGGNGGNGENHRPAETN